MSDIKKWMDIVTSAAAEVSRLANIQPDVAESPSKNGEITINLSLNMDGATAKVASGNSVLPAVAVNNTEKVTVEPEAAPAQGPATAQSNQRTNKENDTVYVSPAAGGGVGRFVSYTKNGAIIDIKGVFRELNLDNFSSLDQQYRDAFSKGNEWFHQTAGKDTPGAQNDKPEFRAGDIVRIEDVYGAVIGPGFGVFIAYSTSGQECIISFDNKEIVVPTANVSPVLEQESKDNFSEMDNDGNLSPISFGTSNVKVEENIKEPAMDQRDDFSKWISTVEEALRAESKPEIAESMPVGNGCGCGAWNCSVCFPETGVDAVDSHDQAQDGTGCPACQGQGCQACDGSELEVDGLELIDDATMDSMVDEEENDFVEKPRSGKGVKLGDIVHKTEFRKTGGQNSPMTFGDDNLDEELPQDADPQDYGKAGRYLQKHFGDGDLDEGGLDEPAQSDFGDVGFGDQEEDEDKERMKSQIVNMQDMGLSKDDAFYTAQQLDMYSPEELKACHDRVMGEVSEAKPMATKTRHHLDDLEDIFAPKQDNLPANVDGGNDEVVGNDEPMRLPAASAADTRQRVGAITPSETMRDLMNRINPTAGEGEEELPDTATNAVALRTAADVPAVISNAMQVSGMQTPEWHTVNNLPGYMQNNIRGMGRKLFSMFTSTPLENIQTLANVNGEGPNTDAEMRAVAGWLRDNAEDMGKVSVGHGMAIPGYNPDVKEYRANGVRFQIVRDPMGQYIYAYPDADAKLGGPDQGQAQIAGQQGGMPRLRESALKPTLLEQMKWDEEIDEAFIEESSLSKLIGKQKGGQNLVKWLHKKHQLSNDASLEPAPFSERLLWKEFKAHPDNFIIISATDGVAGVKPYKKFIDDRTKEFAKRGKTYNPAGDSTLPYQIIAFKDDGQQVDPNLFRQPAEPGEEPEERYSDPTVMKARMGKHTGKDMQNPNNTFNLLADEIGALRTVWVASGAVEREKMGKRAELKKTDELKPRDAVQKIFARVKPVLKTLANQAILQINKRAQRYIEGGNFEGAQKVAASGQKLKQLLVSLDTNSAVNIDTGYGSKTVELSAAISKAIAQASGGSVGSEKYEKYAVEAASGNAAALRPILDALRDNLVGL
jgi:hypothetical protein